MTKYLTKWNECHGLTILFCHIQIPNRVHKQFQNISANNKQAEHLGQILFNETNIKHNYWG